MDLYFNIRILTVDNILLIMTSKIVLDQEYNLIQNGIRIFNPSLKSLSDILNKSMIFTLLINIPLVRKKR